MKIERVDSIESLHAFLTGTCGFSVKAGFDRVSDSNARSVYVVNDADDTLEVIVVDEASSGVLNDLLKELTIESPVEQYQMIVQGDFQKIAIQRAKSPPSWGIKSRYRIVYRSTMSKEDTRKSLLAKINGLRYETGSEQKAFHDLFDVKEIVDKFYIDYEKFRAKLAKGITFPKGFEVSDDDRDEYATIIMNRIVFTYFIQVPSKGTSIIPDHFLQDLYARYHESKKTPSFYHCLCKLWFEYFNADAPRSPSDGMFEKIPYLNGGLFSYVSGIEVDGVKTMYKGVTIPDDTWDDLFKMFDGYEWTIVENDEDDELLGITPSILGHIYEKSCNQGETGSYYTPDTITNYISKECIARHVTARVNKQFKKDHVNFIDEVIGKGKLSREEISELEWAYTNVITNITICDNACGSGAFLIAAEKILVDIYQKCLEWIDEDDVPEGVPFDKDDVRAIKRYIVTNNIYGVDIQEGSVEIAKLRLWLSMISSMQGGHVEPLPNIDYNILTGDSLLGFTRMPVSWGSSLLSNPDILRDMLSRWQQVKNEYKATRSSARSFTARNEIEDLNGQIRGELDALYGMELNATRGINASDARTARPFHWRFEFQEVFEKGGFDIIIGNPPYINTRKLSKMPGGKSLKNIYKQRFKTASGCYDICVLFVERTRKLLNKHGVLGYIISNKFLVTDYGEETRKFCLNHYGLERMLDVSDFNVFLNVGIYPIIFVFTTNKENKIMEIASNIESYDHFVKNKYAFTSIPRSTFSSLKGKIFAIHLTEDAMPVVNAMITGAIYLSDDDFACGITGFNYTKVGKHITDTKPSGKHWKFVVTGNITPFAMSWGTRVHYFKTTWNHPYLPSVKDITGGKKQLYDTKNKVIIRGMAKRLTAAVDTGGMAIGTSVYAIVPPAGVDPYFLSGLFNSDLFNFYYNAIYRSKHLQGGFISYNVSQLSSIPLRKFDPKNADHAKVASLARDLESGLDATKIKELNDLVYTIYGITGDHARIVEASSPGYVFSAFGDDDIE